MIKKLIKTEIINGSPMQSITMAAFVVAVAGVASRILGLLRDRILASQFGAGDILDAYYAAFRIPDTIYNLLVLGALSAAFIPIFTELISGDSEQSKKRAWKLSYGILTLEVLLIGIISVLVAIFAPYLVKLITPGFEGEKLNNVVMLTRIMFLSPLFLSISAVFGGILTSFKKFLIYSIAPIMYNIGIIAGAIFLVPLWGISGLAWGVVLGAFLHMLIQYPAVKFSGFKYFFSLDSSMKNKDVYRVIKLMIPRTLGVAISQINFLIITIFASTLAAGSLTVFNLANNIQSAPLGLFGVSFAIAAFPTLSAYAAKKDFENFNKNFSKLFRQILFFVLPFSVLMLILRAQIVRVFLGAGKFDWEDTILTFQTLGIMTISLFAQSLIPLLARSFYALQNTRIPFFAALFSEMVNVFLVFILIGRYGVVGLAIAFSAASILNMLILVIMLHKKVGNLGDKKIFDSVLRISLATIIAGVTAQILKYIVNLYVGLETFVGVFLQLAVSGGTALMVFAIVCYFLDLEEFLNFKNSIGKKIFREKKKIVEDTSEVAGIQ